MAEPQPQDNRRRRIPSVQLVRTPNDLDRVQFYENMALIEVPVEALDALPFKNDQRENDPRLKAVVRSIRDDGYNNVSPIKVRLGRRGRWVVIDGGHRLTAARKVSREFWTNLFGPKVRSLHFLMYRTPLSNTLLGVPPDGEDPDGPPGPGALAPGADGRGAERPAAL